MLSALEGCVNMDMMTNHALRKGTYMKNQLADKLVFCLLSISPISGDTRENYFSPLRLFVLS